MSGNEVSACFAHLAREGEGTSTFCLGPRAVCLEIHQAHARSSLCEACRRKTHIMSSCRSCPSVLTPLGRTWCAMLEASTGGRGAPQGCAEGGSATRPVPWHSTLDPRPFGGCGWYIWSNAAWHAAHDCVRGAFGWFKASASKGGITWKRATPGTTSALPEATLYGSRCTFRWCRR